LKPNKLDCQSPLKIDNVGKRKHAMTTISLRLTQAQRKVVANLLTDLADRLLLGTKNQRTIQFDRQEIEAIQQSAKAAISSATNGMVRNSLRHVFDATKTAIKSRSGIGAISKSERLYQFRISIKEIKPEIWRRIQVREGTLDRLHEHFQTAMGWTNSHLHQFVIDGERYGDPELLDDDYGDSNCVDSTVTKLSEIVPRSGKRFQFEYEYDFGDCWQHQVLFEGCLQATKAQRYPLCLEGERACPPEDVGGICGYSEFLAVIADPDHEDHKRLLRWAGKFDSREFSAEKMTKRMWRGLPDWRNME